MKPQNELIGLDFIMKVAGCRAADQLCTHYPQATEHITFGSAYSDKAAVTSCRIGGVSTGLYT